MPKYIITVFLSIYSGIVFAQKTSNSFTYPAKGKQVIIDAKEASMDIEGYDGNELIIEPHIPSTPVSITETNKGLTLISEIIPESNTVNPTIVKQDASLVSVLLPKGECRHLKIRVPRNAHLKVDFSNTSPDGKISLKNLSGELEIGGSIKIIEVSHITGPLTISAGGDGFNAGASEKIVISHLQFSESSLLSNSPIPLLNIIGSLANVDISLPETLKATIQVDLPSGGELFSDLNLVPPKPKPGTYTPQIKNKFIGELNGGGKMITINAGYGNVFIRKQQ